MFNGSFVLKPISLLPEMIAVDQQAHLHLDALAFLLKLPVRGFEQISAQSVLASFISPHFDIDLAHTLALLFELNEVDDRDLVLQLTQVEVVLNFVGEGI